MWNGQQQLFNNKNESEKKKKNKSGVKREKVGKLDKVKLIINETHKQYMTKMKLNTFHFVIYLSTHNIDYKKKSTTAQSNPIHHHL